jgi:arylsulfatase A-like enzyme
METSERRRPNILLVVSDQERQRSWLPAGVSLPWRDRLRADGMEFTNYFTHSSPCSPSRASMFTGRYLAGHGVVDNVIMPEHHELPSTTPTLGSLLQDAGYRSSYIGKWHLSHSPTPDMEAYGFADWDGNDRHFMGWAGTGVHFDPIIATNAAHWIEKNAAAGANDTGGNGAGVQPWFLTVALVNPHDVMWFPVDQPGYRERHPDDVAAIRRVLEAAAWKDDDPLPTFDEPYPEVVDRLPANFDDDLHTKPEAHRQWRWDQQHGLWGYIDPEDTASWLRHLDYYVHLQRLADQSLGTVLAALERSGAWDDTAIFFTSDHGDMCGSHGLRSKGPFVYDEIMRVPLYAKVPGATTAASVTDALGSHVDLAATICALAGLESSTWSTTVQGMDLAPVLSDPQARVRDHVLFAHDSAQTEGLNKVRYALRGFYDGRTKYARYYGVGGGKPSTGLWGRPAGEKIFGVDCAFDDNDHEWYDHDGDPEELVNLANDRSRRKELTELFERLGDMERESFVTFA